MKLVVPMVSDAVKFIVVEELLVAQSQTFVRGDGLVKILVTMAEDGEALDCPPEVLVVVVASEPGTINQWNVKQGDQVPPGTTLAVVSGFDSVAQSTEERGSSSRPLRCSTRELIE